MLIACRTGLTSMIKRSSTLITFGESGKMHSNASNGFDGGFTWPCSTSREMSSGPSCCQVISSIACKGATTESMV